MTSVNSSTNRFKLNMKRRIWVWVVCVVALVGTYVGPLSVILSRYARYKNNSDYYYDMSQYYRDIVSALLSNANKEYINFLIIAIAVVIGVQGFSYLFSRQKVDMYNSVPVSMKKRFGTIYINGIIIFIVGLTLSYLLTIVLVMFRGVIVGLPLGKLFLLYILSIFLFLGAYNLTILAVMLTGNVFMSLVMSLTLIFYADIWVNTISQYRRMFYTTLLTYYDKVSTGISVFAIFNYAAGVVGRYYSDFTEDITATGFALLKLIIWSAVAFILSYRNFCKRPAEAAGSSMAFYSSRLMVKLLISVPVTLWLARWMYNTTEQSMPFMIGTLVLGTIVISLVTEIAFNLELKSAFRHWGTIIVSLLIVMCFFGIYKFDVFGYDNYVPKADKISSYAVINSTESYYTDCINFDAYANDYINSDIGPYRYAKENMFLTDTEAIVALAKKSQVILEDNRMCDDDVRCLEVLYRTNSGKEKARYIWVDLNDKENDAYLNRIVGPAYYKQGIWQALTMDIPTNRVYEVYYQGILGNNKLRKSEVEEIIDLWKLDMDEYDYSRVRYDKEIGYIWISFDNGYSWSLPVYECFDNIMAYVQASEGYIAPYLPIDAIESINVTYYPNSSYGEYMSPEEYTFSDRETIEMIMGACDTYAQHRGWQPYDQIYDYNIEVIINPSYINVYKKYTFYEYHLVEDGLKALRAAEILP